MTLMMIMILLRTATGHHIDNRIQGNFGESGATIVAVCLSYKKVHVGGMHRMFNRGRTSVVGLPRHYAFSKILPMRVGARNHFGYLTDTIIELPDRNPFAFGSLLEFGKNYPATYARVR